MNHLARLALSLCLLVFAYGCENQTPTPPPAAPAQRSEIDKLIEAAEGGDVKAQLDLAHRYDAGNGIPKDPQAAFKWVSAAAKSGNVEAMVALAQRYEDGVGVSASEVAAREWLKKAADLGSGEAQYRYASQNGFLLRGFIFLLGSTPDEEKQHAEDWARYLKLAAEQGHLQAQHDLGMLNILGVKGALPDTGSKSYLAPNVSEGVRLLRNAADSGYWEAHWALAVLYQSGYRTIKPDAEESAKWWDRLSAHADPEVQRKIGLRYDHADEKNYEEGKNKWMGKKLTFSQTNAVAKQWYEKAMVGGDAQATYQLADLYKSGRGVYKDDAKAAELLKQAAEKNYVPAFVKLGFSYLNGDGITKDYNLALELFSKAANQDSDAYQASLGRNAIGAMHELGMGVNKDPVLAYAWYNVAVPGGYEKAKENLARMEKELTMPQVTKAQQLSRNWVPGRPMVTDATPTVASGTQSVSVGPGLMPTKSGTGFVISRSGNLLTNFHVVEDCTQIRVPAEGNQMAQVLVADKTNDLAVLKLTDWSKPSAVISATGTVAQGEEIVVFGFPLDGFLPNSGNLTLGVISALAGPQNNASLVQITAPVQPGNSGGPLLNKKGQVVGIVVGKANAINIAKATGDIPQNINYAVAGPTVKSFLDGNHVDYEKGSRYLFLTKEASQIADEARSYSVKLECWSQ